MTRAETEPSPQEAPEQISCVPIKDVLEIIWTSSLLDAQAATLTSRVISLEREKPEIIKEAVSELREPVANRAFIQKLYETLAIERSDSEAFQPEEALSQVGSSVQEELELKEHAGRVAGINSVIACILRELGVNPANLTGIDRLNLRAALEKEGLLEKVDLKWEEM